MAPAWCSSASASVTGVSTTVALGAVRLPARMGLARWASVAGGSGAGHEAPAKRGRDAQRGELGVGHLDEYFLFLLADEVDLGHARHVIHRCGREPSFAKACKSRSI